MDLARKSVLSTWGQKQLRVELLRKTLPVKSSVDQQNRRRASTRADATARDMPSTPHSNADQDHGYRSSNLSFPRGAERRSKLSGEEIKKLRSRYGGEALSPQASCNEAAQRFSQVRSDFRRMMEEGARAAERRAINASEDGGSSSPPRLPLQPPARPPPPAPASPAGDYSSVPAAALISPAAQGSLVRARLAELNIAGNGSAAPAAATRSPAAAAATACSPAAAASSQEAGARMDSGDDSPRSEGSSPRTPGAGWALSRSRLASAASTTRPTLNPNACNPNSMSDLISEVKRADADKRARRLLEEREMIAARQALNRKLRAITTLQTAMRKRRWRKMISSNSTHGPTCAPAACTTPPAQPRPT